MNRSLCVAYAACGMALPFALAGAQPCSIGVVPNASNISSNGQVLASAQWDPDGDGPREPVILIAGELSQVGGFVAALGIAAFDPRTYQWTDDIPQLTGTVRSLLVTDSNDIYATGEFFPGGSVRYIAKRVGATWTYLDPGPLDSVTALVDAPNGDIIAGGIFTTAGGVPALRVARWTGTAWAPMGDGFDGPVRALARTSNGTIYAGGEFTASGAQHTGHLAKWDGASWQPVPTPIQSGNVYALAALEDGSLAVGGSFTTINDDPYPYIARLADGQWNPLGSLAGNVNSLSVKADGYLYANGDFADKSGVARWTGTTWQGIVGDFGTLVRHVVPLPDDQTLISGNLLRVNSIVSGYLTILSHAFDPVGSFTDGPITSAVRDGRGGCIVIGPFTTVGGVAANRIARWDGVTFHPLGDGLPSPPRAVYVLRNGDVIASGQTFTAFGGFGHLARWNGSTWSFFSFPVNQWINDIAELPNGDIIVAGSIYTVTPGGIKHVARWNGNTLEPMGEGVNGTPTILRTAADGQPVVGGNIVNSIMQWTGTYWRSLDEGLQSTPSGSFSLTDLEVLENGDLLAVGGFNYAGGSAIDRLARWDGTDWFPVAPSSFTGSSTQYLRQIELLEDGSLAGLSSSGSSRHTITVWDGIETRTLFQEPTNIAGSITGILELNNEIIVYGSFGRLGRSDADNFARYAFSNTPWTAIHPEPVVVAEGQTVVLTATPATGYEHVRVRWQRNGVFINDGPGGAAPGGGEVSDADAALEPITDGTPARLIISNAQFEDGGEYTAVFSTDCGSNTSRPASVTVNPACPACIADFNGDGGVTGDDLAAFVAEFEQGFNCADVNADGGVTFDDFAAFLLAFEAGGC